MNGSILCMNRFPCPLLNRNNLENFNYALVYFSVLFKNISIIKDLSSCVCMIMSICFVHWEKCATIEMKRVVAIWRRSIKVDMKAYASGCHHGIVVGNDGVAVWWPIAADFARHLVVIPFRYAIGKVCVDRSMRLHGVSKLDRNIKTLTNRKAYVNE